MVDELERLGIRDNTLVFYIFGDNGSSAEGQNGTISELLAQNQIPNTIEQHLKALDGLGGLDALGRTQDGQHVPRRLGLGRRHAVPAHQADRLPLRRHPQSAWRFPGPRASEPDKTPRSQFHHVNDIAPTIYEILGIQPPKVVDGFAQDPIDGDQPGLHLRPTPRRPSRKHTQYFDNNGSRGIYQDGWYACTFGPLTPWLTVQPGAGHLGPEQGPLGALRPHRTTSPRPTIWPRRSRSDWTP
ncbi:MAG: hypothetical protein V9F04_10745 [Dermatophilaceae bacterium]